MAINAYIGLMGSGKSFEVVSSVIVPNLLKGRRVVTNIDGINVQAIDDYLINVKKGQPHKLGKLICVTNEDVCKVGFFPDETKPGQAAIVQGGDLVCVDECWNFWGDDHKITEEHMRFFRMHRHYTHPENGVTCDLALMIQDLGTLNRKIRVVVEMTTRTVKLKTIGAPKAYRIELYEGNKTTKGSKFDTLVKLYDKAIFPLYKSYAAGSGNEKPIDKRQNVLTNPRIWVMGVLVLAMFGFGGYMTYRFFKPATSPKISLQPGPSSVSPGAPAATRQNTPAVDFSPEWRYAGAFTANGASWAVVVDAQGRLRVESPSVFTSHGISAIGVVDGQRVATYSGGNSHGGTLPAIQSPSSPSK